MTLLLAAVVIVLAVAGAESVRATCRRRLSAPVLRGAALPAEASAGPADASAVAEAYREPAQA